MANDNDDKGKGTTPEATICARCKYSLADPHYQYWRCTANTPTNFVTGEPWHDFCGQKNATGKCPDYEECESDV